MNELLTVRGFPPVLICRHHLLPVITDSSDEDGGLGGTLVLQVKHNHLHPSSSKLWNLSLYHPPCFLPLSVRKPCKCASAGAVPLSRWRTWEEWLCSKGKRQNLSENARVQNVRVPQGATTWLLLLCPQLYALNIRHPERPRLNSKTEMIIFHLANVFVLSQPLPIRKRLLFIL